MNEVLKIPADGVMVEHMGEVERLRLYHSIVQQYKLIVPCSQWDKVHRYAAKICRI